MTGNGDKVVIDPIAVVRVLFCHSINDGWDRDGGTGSELVSRPKSRKQRGQKGNGITHTKVFVSIRYTSVFMMFKSFLLFRLNRHNERTTRGTICTVNLQICPFRR